MTPRRAALNVMSALFVTMTRCREIASSNLTTDSRPMKLLEQLKKLFQHKPRITKTDITKRFDLIGRVGQGSMSKVWRARDAMSGKIVALKVLDKVKTEKLEARFTGRNKPSEGEIAMQLKHPNVVR